MSERKSSLPEIILARLAAGAVPVDGIFWLERPRSSWIERGRRRAPTRGTDDAPAPDAIGRAPGKCADCI